MPAPNIKRRKRSPSRPLKKKGLTIPYDVAVLVLVGILFFIIFTMMYRGCRSENKDVLIKLEQLP